LLGFSALSLLLFHHEFPPFAGTPINRLRLPGNIELQHAIAYTFQWQMLPALQDAWVRGTPNYVLQFLTSSFRRQRGELYTMAIFRPGFQDGHAITPYAVDNRGHGRYDVLVYDNNWPDQVRRVHFDTNTDSWSYVAAVNPSVPDAVYSGDARTGTLSLIPTTPGLGVHFCPFCAAAAGRRNAYNEIRLQGNPYNQAHLLIRDQQGRALGYEGGTLVNLIPGARAVFPTAFSDRRQRQEPVYRLPIGVNVQVTVDGSGLRYPDTEHVSLIGQNHDLAIDGIEIRPGEHESISLNGGDQASMTYTSAGSQIVSPLMIVGLVRQPGNYSIGAQALTLHPDSIITISDDATTSTLAIHDTSASGQTYELQTVPPGWRHRQDPPDGQDLPAARQDRGHPLRHRSQGPVAAPSPLNDDRQVAMLRAGPRSIHPGSPSLSEQAAAWRQRCCSIKPQARTPGHDVLNSARATHHPVEAPR
jgi:hypothetical protein